MTPQDRSFLFLQGPHGPFMGEVAAHLHALGAQVLRVGFNAGDRAEWPRALPYAPHEGSPAAWPDRIAALLDGDGHTDLVLYGDARPCHAAAVTAARRLGIAVHVLEEGYLRPHWITYERGGANARSPLAGLSMARIVAAMADAGDPLPEAPARWGDAHRHAWHGALYHARILAGRSAYPCYRSHREPGIAAEAWLNARRLVGAPRRTLSGRLRFARLAASGAPFHLVLLQLGHDAAMRHDGPFASVGAFMARCAAAFAEGAPEGHHLVFKTHPFEDLREPLPAIARHLAREHGLAGRLSLIHGGPLGALLDRAQGAVTVNSTAAQQALWRGLPVAALGRAVYARPGLVSARPLAAFFAEPDPPDPVAYAAFRRVLLRTSQIRGSFYARTGRAAAIPVLAGRMLDPADPYAGITASLRRAAPPALAAE